MRPIEISVYPGSGAHLVDGRHRLAVARERGDTTIRAIVREYSRSGRLVSKRETTISIETL